MLETQLTWIHWIQSFGNPFIGSFFTSLNFLDTSAFFLLLLMVLWTVFSWKIAMRIFCIGILSGVINILLKELFQMPRPCALDPSICKISLSSYGFPSGAAQSAILLGGILFYKGKTFLQKGVAFLYFFFLSLSRVFLGVHFPTDILGGWAFGSILLAFYLYGLPKLEKKFMELSTKKRVFVSFAVPFLIMAFFHRGKIPLFMLFTFTFFLGSWISYYQKWFLKPVIHRWQKIALLLPMTLGCLFFAYVSVHAAHVWLVRLALALIGIWISLGYHLLAKLMYPFAQFDRSSTEVQ